MPCRADRLQLTSQSMMEMSEESRSGKRLHGAGHGAAVAALLRSDGDGAPRPGAPTAEPSAPQDGPRTSPPQTLSVRYAAPRPPSYLVLICALRVCGRTEAVLIATRVRTTDVRCMLSAAGSPSASIA